MAVEDEVLERRLWNKLPGWAKGIILLFLGLSSGGGVSTFAWAQIAQHEHRELTKTQASEVDHIVDKKIEQKLETLRLRLLSLETTSQLTSNNVMRLMMHFRVDPTSSPSNER